jgi:aminoglycoside phosphotransferase (APT) family kinase protein
MAVPDAVAKLLAHVLQRPVTPESLAVQRPVGGGWSNDTTLVTLAEDGRQVVVRQAPERASMFPAYDLRREYGCLRTLGDAGTVPVPALLGENLEGDITGRPAFVMAFVRGRVPADDRPSFAEAGWLHDAARADQRRFHEALLAAVAAVNAVRPDEVVIASLRRPGPSPCVALVDDLARIWAFDRGDAVSPVVDAAFVEVSSDIPQEASTDVMLWGDARPANVIVQPDGFAPAALVDFELAAWGPAELDVTWLAEMNRMRTTGSGIDPLPGFLDDTAAIAHYERCADRRLDADVLHWATRFNALKIAVLMHRHLRVMVHEGRLPADHRVFTENVSTRRCLELR